MTLIRNRKTEKKPAQKNRTGSVQRYFLASAKSVAAPITVAETVASQLTEKSMLKDNSFNTVRSSSSRNVLRFTTGLLIQGLSACPKRPEPRVFLPASSSGLRTSRGPTTALIPQGNSNKETARDSTRLRQKEIQHKYQISATLVAAVHCRFPLSQAGTLPGLGFGG